MGYINALSGSNDIKLEHSAGFKEITEDGIIQFISTDNRLECLKKMLSALIQLKSGNEKCRIVIADEKNSILMWIAALSYIFPIENSLQLSFTTYGYSIGDFDINGVFVAELNNCKKTDDIAVTDYNFLQAQRSYAVFDFLELYFAPDAEVYNNLFMSMVENSFTINRQILEQYKNYVLAATSYRKMDSEYMDGAVLYMFMEKNKRLSSEQIKAAVIFARKYANKLEKRRIFEKVMSVYKEYVSDAIAQDVLIDYVRYCVNEGISSQKEVESILMNDVKITFLDLENVSFEMFSEQGRISEKICGFMDGYMEIAFVNAIGIDRLYGFMEQLQKHRDVQRISYIHTAICHYVNDGKGSFKYGGIEQRIASKIIGVFVIDDTAENVKRLDALIKKTNQIVTSVESQFLYTNAVYKTLQEKKLIKLSKKVVEDVAKAYLQHDPHTQKQLVSIIDRCGASSVYLPLILDEITKNTEPNERLVLLTSAISSNKSEFQPYATHIRKQGLIVGDYKLDSDFYFNAYKFLKHFEHGYGVPLSVNEMQMIMEKYMNHLQREHRNFIISKDQLHKLETLFREYRNFASDRKMNNLISAFMLISEMGANITNMHSCVFNGKNPYSTTDYCLLNSIEQDGFIESVSKYIASYWLYSRKLPNFPQLFDISDETQEEKVVSILFGEILDNVIESDSRNRSDVMVQIVELAIFMKLDLFLTDLPEKLVNSVKQSEILKPLEKDLEGKRHFKNRTDVLSKIDTLALNEQVQRIRAAYEERVMESPLGKAKQVLGSFMSSFKKDKK